MIDGHCEDHPPAFGYNQAKPAKEVRQLVLSGLLLASVLWLFFGFSYTKTYESCALVPQVAPCSFILGLPPLESALFCWVAGMIGMVHSLGGVKRIWRGWIDRNYHGYSEILFMKGNVLQLWYKSNEDITTHGLIVKELEEAAGGPVWYLRIPLGGWFQKEGYAAHTWGGALKNIEIVEVEREQTLQIPIRIGVSDGKSFVQLGAHVLLHLLYGRKDPTYTFTIESVLYHLVGHHQALIQRSRALKSFLKEAKAVFSEGSRLSQTVEGANVLRIINETERVFSDPDPFNEAPDQTA